MRRSGEECFLLESVEGGEAIGRYTFLGCRPVGRFEISGGSWRLEEGDVIRRGEDPLRALERAVVRPGFVPDLELPPLSGGAVGFLGYDAVRIFETIPDRHLREGRIPDGLFLLFDAVVAFDHVRQRLLLVTALEPKQPGDEEREVEAASARLDRLEALLRAEPELIPMLTLMGSKPSPSIWLCSVVRCWISKAALTAFTAFALASWSLKTIIRPSPAVSTISPWERWMGSTKAEKSCSTILFTSVSGRFALSFV